MNQISKNGELALKANNGEPLAKLTPPIEGEEDIFGYLAGKVKIVGDIVGPVTPLEHWKCK